MERDFFTKKRSIELSSNPGLEELEKYKDHAMVSNRTLDDYITPISSLPN
jgi:hypothetical protein